MHYKFGSNKLESPSIHRKVKYLNFILLSFSFFKNFLLQMILVTYERYKTFFIGFLSNFEPITLRPTCKEKVDVDSLKFAVV